jgi:hypothetical protein
MLDDLGDFSLLSCSYFPPYPLKEVDGKCPESKPPTLVSNTMLPENVSGEGRVWLRCITNEAPNGMSIEGKEKDKCKVMRIPKRLEALLSYFVMGSCVHQHHTEKHNVPCDSSGLSVMNLQSCHWSNLGLFDIVKIDIM